MPKKPPITDKQRKSVALRKLEGKTWPQIRKETGLSHASLARILQDNDTLRFMAELRAEHAETLTKSYALILATAYRDLEQAKDPATATKLRRHLLQIVTAQHSGRGGDRTQSGPLVAIDNRTALPPPPEGTLTIREMLMAIRQPPKEDVN